MAVTIDTFYSEQYLEGARPSIPSNPIGVIEPVLNPPGVPIGHSPVTIGTPANGLSINDTSQVLSLSFPIASGQVAFGTGAGVIGGKTTFSTAASTLTIGINANNGIAENAVLNIIGSTDNVLFPTNHARSAIINFTSNNQSGGVPNSYLSSIQNTISGNLEFIVNSVTKLHISRVNDRIGVLTVSPTETIDVNGTARIRTIDNLGSTPAEVLVPSATGAVSKRTLAEFASDLGIGSIISGTFTPVLTDSTSGATYSASVVSGKYYKSGNRVDIYIAMSNFTTTGTPTGYFEVTELPFTVDYELNARLSLFIGIGVTDLNLALIEPRFFNGATKCELYYKNINGKVLSNSLTGTGNLVITGSYITV